MREQGVWGEATHTREMSVDARFLKSGKKDIRRKIDKIGILRKSIMNYHFTVCFFSFEYTFKFRRIFSTSTGKISGIEGYSKDNQQTVTNFHSILDSGSFVGAERLLK